MFTLGVLSYHLLTLFVLSARVRGEYFAHHSGSEGGDLLTNEWIVRVEGGEQVAQLLALETGCIYGGKVADFPNTYIFVRDEHTIERRDHSSITRSLFENPKVQWAEQLIAKKRQKRDFTHPYLNAALWNPSSNSKFKSIVFGKFKGFGSSGNLSTVLDEVKPLERVKRGDMKVPKQEERMFNDELWSQEWYLHDTRTEDDLPKLDLNVIPVYKMGITGKGVKVSILDDGIEYLHDDLKANYDPSLSWDCNEKDSDPAPKYDSTHRNAHGTRCAGEVAMTANNGKCGVGIAYGASIGGIKLLDGLINDRVEGAALGFGFDKIDIYSASWGPNDDGQTVEGPGRLAQEALERGIFQGRDGRGTIFVFASGNGGSHDDNCNCDGYIGSIYTVAIGSASQRGAFPWYGEPCAATMAVTYSSGAYQDQMITTTDLNNGCTIKHTGTSASAPLAAGIIALALEANKNLTWRDVQHLIVWTSEYMPLADNLGWQMNGAGFRFDVRFGFGLMNAHALVSAAINWINVPPKSICKVKSLENINVSISYNTLYRTQFESTGCSGEGNEVNFLEHLELKFNILYSIRGVLEVYLTSPGGTKLPVLSHRRLDRSNKGFTNWKFMSVGTWGEDPRGTWTLEIIDEMGPPTNHGKVGSLTLILHGTKNQPDYIKDGPKVYNTAYQSFDNFYEEDNPLEQETSIKDIESNHLENFNQHLIGSNSRYFPQNDEKKADSLTSVLNLFNPLKSIYEAKQYANIFKDYMNSMPQDINDEDRVLSRVHHQNSRIHDEIKKIYDDDIDRAVAE